MSGPTPPTERPTADHRYTAPTPTEPPAHNKDRSDAISTINNYLSFNKFPISLKLKPLPSNKDISETLKFLLSRLEYPLSNKLEEEDLFLVLKFFNCPVKFDKSAFKEPGTPHSFPSVLAVMHWLVQLALYNERVVNSTNVISNDVMFNYTLTSYLHYIAGDDNAVDREDAAFREKIESELNTVKEEVNVKAENAKELERKLETMRSGPSLREIKEEEKSVLEKDLKNLIEQLKDHKERAEKQMEEKEKALAVKVEERSRLCAENEELKKKLEEHGFNMRDAKRMKRELQAVERDIGEALQLECNQAIRRLKLGNGFQYELNAKGSTPIEVLGDCKSTLKPGLNSSIEEVKRTKMESLESKGSSAKIKAKENLIAILQSQIDEQHVNVKLDIQPLADEEIRDSKKREKEAKLATWKWNDVIEIECSDDESIFNGDDDTLDDVLSMSSIKRKK